jgi:hypothetical protein
MNAILDRGLIRSGFIIWLGATLALRFGGQHLLRPGDWRGTLILFAVTFPLIAWLVRGLCVRAGCLNRNGFAGRRRCCCLRCCSILFPARFSRLCFRICLRR